MKKVKKKLVPECFISFEEGLGGGGKAVFQDLCSTGNKNYGESKFFQKSILPQFLSGVIEKDLAGGLIGIHLQGNAIWDKPIRCK